MNALLVTITDLGDVAVVTAVALVTAAQLARWGNRSAAWTLLFALASAAVGIGFLKLIFIGCGAELFNLRISSPSGHAALSSAVFGVIGAIFARSLQSWLRLVPALLAVLLVGAITTTRVVLGMHSIDEVLVGLVVGGAVLLAALGLLRMEIPTARPLRLRRLSMLVAFTLVLTDGINAPAEQLIRSSAAIIHRSTPLCAATEAGFPPTLASILPSREQIHD
jgi:membrane-associated phospholipid phosphatase